MTTSWDNATTAKDYDASILTSNSNVIRVTWEDQEKGKQ